MAKVSTVKKSSVKKVTKQAPKKIASKVVNNKKDDAIASKPKKSTESIDKNIFPIGKFTFDENTAKKNIKQYIKDIEELPKLLKVALKKVDKKNKNNSYRDGGWTIEQIIHHTADSHMNAFIRFKLALTETAPIIKPYSQNLFAETTDIFASDLKSSYRILKGLHKRWSVLLQNMSDSDFKNYYVHPEYKVEFSLLHALALYAWHGKHHVAQIEVAINQK
jgi:uncharacterized damage-inducible protein DinB